MVSLLFTKYELYEFTNKILFTVHCLKKFTVPKLRIGVKLSPYRYCFLPDINIGGGRFDNFLKVVKSKKTTFL